MLVARLENADLQLEAAVVDVAAIVRACVEGFGELAAQRALDLRLSAPGAPARGRRRGEARLGGQQPDGQRDPPRPAGGIVRCSLSTAPGRLVLEVADDGPGVAARRARGDLPALPPRRPLGAAPASAWPSSARSPSCTAAPSPSATPPRAARSSPSSCRCAPSASPLSARPLSAPSPSPTARRRSSRSCAPSWAPRPSAPRPRAARVQISSRASSRSMSRSMRRMMSSVMSPRLRGADDLGALGLQDLAAQALVGLRALLDVAVVVVVEPRLEAADAELVAAAHAVGAGLAHPLLVLQLVDAARSRRARRRSAPGPPARRPSRRRRRRRRPRSACRASGPGRRP